jgi:chromosome segregation ATPase
MQRVLARFKQMKLDLEAKAGEHNHLLQATAEHENQLKAKDSSLSALAANNAELAEAITALTLRSDDLLRERSVDHATIKQYELDAQQNKSRIEELNQLIETKSADCITLEEQSSSLQVQLDQSKDQMQKVLVRFKQMKLDLEAKAGEAEEGCQQRIRELEDEVARGRSELAAAAVKGGSESADLMQLSDTLTARVAELQQQLESVLESSNENTLKLVSKMAELKTELETKAREAMCLERANSSLVQRMQELKQIAYEKAHALTAAPVQKSMA